MSEEQNYILRVLLMPCLPQNELFIIPKAAAGLLAIYKYVCMHGACWKQYSDSPCTKLVFCFVEA